MSSLKVRYEHSQDDDDFGWLSMVLDAEGFCGRGGFWVQWQDVEQLAEKLKAYPLLADDPPRGVWGYTSSAGREVIIALDVKPIDARGTLRVSVEIADYAEPRRRVQTHFDTHYPQVGRFADELLSVMQRRGDKAELLGE